MTAASAPLFLLAQQTRPEVFGALVGYLAVLVSALGVLVMLWGAYCALFPFIAAEWNAARGQPTAPEGAARRIFTGYLLTGLEFIIAGSIIRLLVVADWQQAIVCAVLVLARTLLGCAQQWERAAATQLLALPRFVDRPASVADQSEAMQQTTDDLAPLAAHSVK